MGVPNNGWFMENPIKIDDLGVPPFQETSIYENNIIAIGYKPQVRNNLVLAIVYLFENKLMIFYLSSTDDDGGNLKRCLSLLRILKQGNHILYIQYLFNPGLLPFSGM